MSIRKGKEIGFYVLVLSALLTVVSFLRYITWAPSNNAMDSLILGGLIAGFVLTILLLLYDNDYLLIAVTVLYSLSLFQLVSNSVGSFADAYQGIVMFGDPTQVGTILSICVFLLASVLCVIASGFMKRVKQ